MSLGVDQQQQHYGFCLFRTQELIPELFYLPELMINANQYQMGRTEEDLQVSDVVLPPWAKTPEEFIRIHRMVAGFFCFFYCVNQFEICIII